jgi:hypothetical protein
LSRDEPEPAHGLGRHSRNSSANEGGASRFWAAGIRSADERAPGGRKPLACLAALEPGLTTYLPWVLCRFALILFVVKILIRKWGAGYFLVGCLCSSSIDSTMDRVADAHWCGPSGLLQHICQFLATRLSGTRHRPTRTPAQGSEHPRPSGPTCTRSMCPLSGQSRLISPARSSHHAYRPCAEPATVSNSSTRESALLELQISTDSA